jgi:hypothetical protein
MIEGLGAAPVAAVVEGVVNHTIKKAKKRRGQSSMTKA